LRDFENVEMLVSLYDMCMYILVSNLVVHALILWYISLLLVIHIGTHRYTVFIVLYMLHGTTHIAV